MTSLPRPPDRVVELLSEHHTNGENVLDQAIEWRPDRWLDADLGTLRKHVGEIADRCESTSTSGVRRIRRRHVFDLVELPSALFLAAMIWGYGGTGYGPWRVGRMRRRAGSTFNSKLERLITASRLGPKETWSAITAGNRMVGLGPAFGTKIAYFAAFEAESGGRKPLIADANTSWAVWSLEGIPRSVERRDTYLEYVDLAYDWARACSVRADDI
jgi:Putative 8-oxoguanine DNA glycosylase OGG-like protein